MDVMAMNKRDREDAALQIGNRVYLGIGLAEVRVVDNTAMALETLNKCVAVNSAREFLAMEEIK